MGDGAANEQGVLNGTSSGGRGSVRLKPRQVQHAPYDELVEGVKAYLADTLENPATLEELAGMFYTSRTKLCLEFKRHCGMSVGEYLLGLRMKRACELLETTKMPLSEIARKVGYRHQSTFSTAFKSECGTTPRQWRKTNASNSK